MLESNPTVAYLLLTSVSPCSNLIHVSSSSSSSSSGFSPCSNLIQRARTTRVHHTTTTKAKAAPCTPVHPAHVQAQSGGLASSVFFISLGAIPSEISTLAPPALACGRKSNQPSDLTLLPHRTPCIASSLAQLPHLTPCIASSLTQLPHRTPCDRMLARTVTRRTSSVRKNAPAVLRATYAISWGPSPRLHVLTEHFFRTREGHL